MSLSNDYKYLNQQEISCKNSINHKKELLFQSAFTWNVLKKKPWERKSTQMFFNKKHWGHNVCMFYKIYGDETKCFQFLTKTTRCQLQAANTRVLFCMLCSQIVTIKLKFSWQKVGGCWLVPEALLHLLNIHMQVI